MSILVLGGAGYIGSHTVYELLAAGRDVDRMEAQIRQFRPRFAAMMDEDAARDLKIRVSDLDVQILSGKNSAAEIAALSGGDTVINSVTGIAGLAPTLSAIEAGKHVALANKETMVAFGDQVMARAKEKGVQILPVDSEHCAIFQCLQGNRRQDVRRLLITASGGPFYRRSAEELDFVTPEMALAHPTWKMGKRITIDSATLMNKGFEVIEAVRLFSVPVEQVEVVIHKESIVHSMVEYVDKAVMAQMSVPDMRLCVLYAMSYPGRFESSLSPLDLAKIGTLHFEAPDLERFPLLALAFESAKRGGCIPAVMNAADEVAVSLFLSGKIRFTQIAKLVSQVTRATSATPVHSLTDVLEADAEARARTLEQSQR